MKNLYIYFAIGISLLIVSCSGSITINPTNDFDCTVPAQASVDTTITLEATVNFTDTRLETCESADLNSLVLTVTSPANEDFSWCKEVHVFMSSTSITEVEVVNTTTVNATTTKIELSSGSMDLSAMVKKKMIMIKIKIKTREAIATQLTCHGKLTIDAKVKDK